MAEKLESEDGPLARIAAAIHANASKLAPEDCEQVVHWMKHWKRELDPRTRSDRDFGTFLDVLSELRSSNEQRGLMAKAGGYASSAAKLKIVALIAFVAAVIVALLPEIRWYWSLGPLAAAVWVYVRSMRREVAAGDAWKDQERRYLMKAIRAATTNEELAWAGLFSHLPGTDEYEEELALVEIERETERLTDALYHHSAGYRTPR